MSSACGRFLGRTFRPEEDLPNADPVVILAHAAWKRLFGGDPSAIGKVIELNQKPYRIVGVMAPDFRPRLVDLWVPLGLPTGAYDARNYFDEHLFAAARMYSGRTVAQANAFIQVLADRVRNSGTTGGAYAQSSGWGLFAVPMTDFMAGETKKPMLVLVGAVGFVLLIACSNIAGLMVTRTAGRAKEIAVRAALGAGRWQLVRQVLAESLLLAAGGAALGLGLAQVGIRLLLAIAPEEANIGLAARLDLHVLAFTALVAMVSGVLFGLAPAWQIARFSPYEILKASGQSVTPSHGRQRLRAVLVIGEAALAVVLLAGAGLFLRSLTRLQDVRPGFDPRGVMTASLSLPSSRYKEPAQRVAFYRAVIERLAGIHGAEIATIGAPLPFSGMGGSGSFSIEGRETGPGDPGSHGDIQYVAPDYFQAMRIPLKSGRYFTDADRQGAEPVFVIDENLARQYWPNENPVGKHMRQGGRAWATIVGVVGHVNRSDLAGDTGKGLYYYCLLQRPIPFATIVVKTSGDPASLGPAIREAVRAVDPTQPVHDLKTMQDMVRNSLAPRRFAVRLLAFFAAVALFMAAQGLYGVISYSVAQRTQEIGLRMALGARSASLLGMVVGQGLRLAGVGVVIGLILAMACSRLQPLAGEPVFRCEPVRSRDVRLDSGGVVGGGGAGELSSSPPRRAVADSASGKRLLRYEVAGHPGRDFFTWQQSRPISDDLAHRRLAFAETGRARRPTQHQRDQLPRKSLDSRLVLPAHSDSKLHLGRVGYGWRGRAMTGVHPQKFRVDLFEREPEVREPLTHDGIRGTGLLERLRPTVDQRPDSFPAVRVADRKLERRGSRTSSNSRDAHPIRPHVFEPNGGEIGHAIRCIVVLRIAELVEQLLLDDIGMHAAAGSRMLGDDERTVGLGFHDGVSDIRQVRNILPIDLRVAAGRLRAALDDVAGNSSRGKLVPIPLAPAEPMDHRGKRQRCIGAAPGDHHLRARRQSLREGKSADVRIRAQHARPNRSERLPGVHIAHLVAFRDQLIQAAVHIVTQHHRHRNPWSNPHHSSRTG